MFKFQEIGIEILKKNIPYKANEYGNIIAAKPNSLEAYNLLKEYHAAAKSSCYSTLSISDIDGEFEGEDWYFFEGEPANQYGPSTYRLESLTHKKKVFANFVNNLSRLTYSFILTSCINCVIIYIERR